MKKRTFLKCSLTALAAGVAALHAVPVSAKKYGVALDKVPALKKAGGTVTIRLAEKDILLIRVSDSEVRGFVAVCTHRACPVSYEKNQIVCHCHSSHFDLDGKVKSGPAQKSLSRVPVVLDGSRIIVGDL
ncbi:MAG: Rieske (2Fe-2S) protein [Deltaproteobacteria bacterium]|nr:Rieske (2Fe-2S) protein [Deltaproteobacteria bacterium]